MFRPAERLAQVQPSATKAMTARARALRAEGRDIITLSQGEPDFDTPAHIADAGIAAIRNGRTRYTDVAGIVELRKAVCAKLHEENGLEFTPEEIIVSCGAKQVLFNALYATLDPGEEVVIPAPCWVSYPELVRLTGGRPRVVQCGVETGFKLTPDALARAITPKTRWLLLNSPCNPTGAVYSRAELAALGEVLRKKPHVWVLCDDIYEKLVYEGTEFSTLAQVCPDLKKRILIVNGVSKSAAMTGWRIGYGAGPKGLIEAMVKIQGQTTSHTSSISQHAAIAALSGNDSYLHAFREAFTRRRDLLIDRLNALPGIEVPTPQGAFYLFLPVDAYLGRKPPGGKRLETDIDLAMYLLEIFGVSLVPGTGFLSPGHLRISYAESEELLTEASIRIANAFRQIE